MMNELLELKNIKRSTELYLRALWARGFCIDSSVAEYESATVNSYIENNKIALPQSISVKPFYVKYYRAAATHAAAHMMYTSYDFVQDDYNLMQRSIVGLVEDLRVELLATREFPGLRKLWLDFHQLQQVYPDNALNLMLRLSRSVLDTGYQDIHQWVTKGRQLILDNLDNLSCQDISLDIGLKLANDLGQMRLPLNSGRYEQKILYRDDNRFLWKKIKAHQQQSEVTADNKTSLIHKNKMKESDKGVELNISDKDFTPGNSLYIHKKEKAGFEYKEYSQTSADKNVLHPEWDYRSQQLKQNWCTLIEKRAPKGSTDTINNIFLSNKETLNRLRYLARKLQTEKQQIQRKMQEGDEFDFDPMIQSMVSIRRKQIPDTRVFVRNEYRQTKSLAISILLDLSESTNQVVNGSNYTVSELLRDAVLLLGETLTIADECFSISGFASNGRHEVNYIKFKNFADVFDKNKTRLAEIKGEYSTRLGAAIRHSAQELAQQASEKKLLLVITDGAPSDIDVFDQRYLDEDCWQAVKSLAGMGIKPFCLNLDSNADSVIEHIFGKGRYETLAHLNRLPDVLSRIYIRYGRH